MPPPPHNSSSSLCSLTSTIGCQVRLSWGADWVAPRVCYVSPPVMGSNNESTFPMPPCILAHLAHVTTLTPTMSFNSIYHNGFPDHIMALVAYETEPLRYRHCTLR